MLQIDTAHPSNLTENEIPLEKRKKSELTYMRCINAYSYRTVCNASQIGEFYYANDMQCLYVAFFVVVGTFPFNFRPTLNIICVSRVEEEYSHN